jgi:hypothetical protein
LRHGGRRRHRRTLLHDAAGSGGRGTRHRRERERNACGRGHGIQRADRRRHGKASRQSGRQVPAGAASLLHERAVGRTLRLLRRDRLGDGSSADGLLARLADRVPTLAAWKDGQGNVRVYQRIMQFNGDRLAWYGGLGDDCVPGYFAVGVQAYTSSISNIAPRVSLALAEAGMKRDFSTLDELMAKFVHPLYAFRERSKGYEVAAMKVAMELLGMKAGPVRPPLKNLTAAETEELRKLMKAYEPMLDKRKVAGA